MFVIACPPLLELEEDEDEDDDDELLELEELLQDPTQGVGTAPSGRQLDTPMANSPIIKMFLFSMDLVQKAFR